MSPSTNKGMSDKLGSNHFSGGTYWATRRGEESERPFMNLGESRDSRAAESSVTSDAEFATTGTCPDPMGSCSPDPPGSAH
jgi:hypothetical protein